MLSQTKIQQISRKYSLPQPHSRILRNADIYQRTDMFSPQCCAHTSLSNLNIILQTFRLFCTASPPTLVLLPLAGSSLEGAAFHPAPVTGISMHSVSRARITTQQR